VFFLCGSDIDRARARDLETFFDLLLGELLTKKIL
jgi:hypothetical protein